MAYMIDGKGPYPKKQDTPTLRPVGVVRVDMSYEGTEGYEYFHRENRYRHLVTGETFSPQDLYAPFVAMHDEERRRAEAKERLSKWRASKEQNG